MHAAEIVLIVLLVAASVFFALNIGGAVIAPSFGAALGARLVSRRSAVLMFSAAVFLGAMLKGGAVAKTLGSGLIPAASFDLHTTVAVLAGAAGALFLANLLHAPQSTTWVTVFSICVVGLLRGNLNHATLGRIFPAWILLPLLCVLLTALLTRVFYPLRGWNYRLYEHLLKHEWKLRLMVLGASCYVGYAIGTNNVALVAAPLASAGVLDLRSALALVAPVIGLGALVITSPSRTVGHRIVPIGLFSACICNVVVGTLMILATTAGIPQSSVQLGVGAVFGIAIAKDGARQILGHKMVGRIFLTWLITPLIAAALTAILLAVLP